MPDSTSGTKDIPAVSWDFFEVYTTVNSSTGTGYYCADAAGSMVEASGLQVLQNGAWTAANTGHAHRLDDHDGADRFAVLLGRIHRGGLVAGRVPGQRHGDRRQRRDQCLDGEAHHVERCDHRPTLGRHAVRLGSGAAATPTLTCTGA